MIFILYVTQISYELAKNFWGNHDSSVGLNFHNDFGGVLAVRDGKYYHLGQEALETCAVLCVFSHFVFEDGLFHLSCLGDKTSRSYEIKL